MNIVNIIKQLRQKAGQTNDPFKLLVISKIIEKINLRSVDSVATFSDLPSNVTEGNLYVVESEKELYYNENGTYYSLGNILGNSALSTGLDDGWGALGTGSSTGRSSPTSVAGGINTWISLSNGPDRHNLALTEDGIAYAWGLNLDYQLGDNTGTNRNSPVTVAGVGGVVWSQLHAGSSKSWGISGGRLFEWATNVITPAVKFSEVANWSYISGGSSGRHQVGIADGIAYAWGNNSVGALGDGTVVNQTSPVTVIGGITNWKQTTAYGDYTLGVTDSGNLYAWGNNTLGELGDDTAVAKSSPVTVVGGITDWNQVSNSQSGFSAGVTDSGNLYTWGNNTHGQLGDNTTVTKSSPVTVAGGITDWKQVSCGPNHMVATTLSGAGYSWGNGGSGQLGDVVKTDRSSPVTLVGGITSWTLLTAGGTTSIPRTIGLKSDQPKFYIQ